MEINLPPPKKRRENVVTIKQRRAFEVYLKHLKNKEPMSMEKILIESGYSPSTAKHASKKITHSRGWDILKKELDGEGAKDAFNDLVSRENEDKRTRLAAAIEITKIQGGYPAQENKIIGIFGKINSISDPEPENDK